jgi:Beta-propeller repeat
VSKPAVANFRMPSKWIAAIAMLTVAAAGVAMFSASGAKNVQAMHQSANKSQPTVSAEQRGRVRASLDALPLAFEANQGQTDPLVKYTARGNGYSVFLTASDAVFAITSAKHSAARPSRIPGTHSQPQTTEKVQSAAIDMRLVGGNLKPEIAAGNEVPGVINYYSGSDPKNWHTGVKQYSSVSYRDVYPGVNMVFHGAQRQLEFDFVVSPGADPKTIGLGFKGAQKLATDASGNLVLASSAGDVVLHKPVAYQEKDGKREIVEAAFQVKSGNEVRLNLGAYDRGQELVIDPTLTYATYLGGSGEDEIFGIALDGSANIYVAGQMNSPNFPAHIGTISNVGNFDAFVTKISASGATLDFTTLIAGAGIDSALGVAVNGTSVYVVGNTSSAAFPATKTLGPAGGQDAFVASLDSTAGTANYVTRIGGTGTESGNAIAVDSSGFAYIGGETDSTNFPTASAIQNTNAGILDGFVAKLDQAGSTLVFSTYLGGTNSDLVTALALALDGSNVYVGGITQSTDFPTTTGVLQTAGKGAGDSFVTEVKADGSALMYSTYLSGTGTDELLGIAVDSAGEAYVTGNTNSSDFPTANAAQTSNAGGNDVFVSKLNATGTGLIFSTYFGGTLDEAGTSIALDAFGDAYVTGRTSSSGFPVSGSPFQGTLSGTVDAFITEFSSTGFVVYSSFLGGTGVENSIAGDASQGPIGAVAVDSSSNAYLAGGTASTTGFTVMSPLACCGAYAGGLSDGFVAKVGAAPADFSVAVSPGSISTTSGQTTSTITVTVSSVNSSFGQAVALSCGSLPAKAVCHFTSASVTPGSSSVTSNLTIATNGASSVSLALPSTDHRTQVFAALFLPIFGITLLGAGVNRRKKRLFGFLVLGLVLAGLMILPACGGGKGGGGGGGGGGTTPGTYNISVSGAGGGANHSAGLTLKVN